MTAQVWLGAGDRDFWAAAFDAQLLRRRPPLPAHAPASSRLMRRRQACWLSWWAA